MLNNITHRRKFKLIIIIIIIDIVDDYKINIY